MNETVDTPLPDADPAQTTYVDLHSHTVHSAFREGVYHTPDDAIQVAKERGLGGLAITGHDTFKGLGEAMYAGEKHGVIVVPGVEIATRSFHGGRPSMSHMIGLFPPEVALELERTGQRPPTLRGTQYVVDWIGKNGGVAVAPHAKPNGGLISLSYKQVAKLEGLHAIETHNKSGENPELVALARQKGIASVGGSDSHHPGEVGIVKTMVLGVCETAQDVLDAIKSGNVRGIIDTPIPLDLHGPRTLSKQLRAQAARTRDKIIRGSHH